MYNSDYHIPMYCDGDDWIAISQGTIGGSCAAPLDCPNVGDVCGDGSLFAGFMAENDGSCRNIFVTDDNQSLSSQWKNATGTDDIVPDSRVNGKVNHANRGGALADFPAFELCENLTDGSHTDWYLPSVAELTLLWLNRAAIDANAVGNFTANNYWSSTESSNNTAAEYVYFLTTSGNQGVNTKTTNNDVRCIRSEPSLSVGGGGGCTAPAACPNVGDVCSGDASGGGNPKFAGCITYYDANSADVGLTKAIYVTQANQSTASPWKNATGTNDISTDSTEDGKINSDNRGGLLSDFPAFELCENLTDGGYTDWYLPARTELDLLWRNAATITGFTTGLYWSSTESTTGSAWDQTFSNGNQGTSTKTSGLDVRCVRRD